MLPSESVGCGSRICFFIRRSGFLTIGPTCLEGRWWLSRWRRSPRPDRGFGAWGVKRRVFQLASPRCGRPGFARQRRICRPEFFRERLGRWALVGWTALAPVTARPATTEVVAHATRSVRAVTSGARRLGGQRWGQSLTTESRSRAAAVARCRRICVRTSGRRAERSFASAGSLLRLKSSSTTGVVADFFFFMFNHSIN